VSGPVGTVVHTGEHAIHIKLVSLLDIAPKVYDLIALACGRRLKRHLTAASFRVSAPAVGLMASGLPEKCEKPKND
jgi:hypothetical protein